MWERWICVTALVKAASPGLFFIIISDVVLLIVLFRAIGWKTLPVSMACSRKAVVLR